MDLIYCNMSKRVGLRAYFAAGFSPFIA